MGLYTIADLQEQVEITGQIKSQIGAAIEAKGGSVEGKTFAEYADAVNDIPTGGSIQDEKSVSIDHNGTSFVVPDEGFDGIGRVNISVNVELPGASKSYFDGHVDWDGLRAIGWTDDQIQAYEDNVPHFAYEDYKYIVSEENKALYGTVNWTNLSSYLNDPNLEYMPYSPLEPGTIFINRGVKYANYLKAIPDLPNLVNGFEFRDCKCLEYIPAFTAKAGDSAFYDCPKLRTVCPFDVTGSIYNIFYNGTSITKLPYIDASGVGNANGAFYKCTNLMDLDIKTTGVQDMGSMFRSCRSLTDIPRSIDCSSATSTAYMFQGCDSIESANLDLGSSATADSMFSGCSSLETADVHMAQSVDSADSMFLGCSALKTANLGVDVERIANADNMFKGLNLLEYARTNGAKIGTGNYMFNSCSGLMEFPDVDITEATGVNYMFAYAHIHGDVPDIVCGASGNIIQFMNGINVDGIMGNIIFPNATGFNSCFQFYTVSPTKIGNIELPNVISANDFLANASKVKELGNIYLPNVSTALQLSSLADLESIGDINYGSVASNTNILMYSPKLTHVGTIDIHSLGTASATRTLGLCSQSSNLTEIRFASSVNCQVTMQGCPNLSYDSIKSLLTAMAATTFNRSRTVKLNNTIADPDGELAALVAACTSKQFAITGLTLV